MFAVSFQTRYVNLLLFSLLYLKMQRGKVCKKNFFEREEREHFSGKILIENSFCLFIKVHSEEESLFPQTHLEMLS